MMNQAIKLAGALLCIAFVQVGCSGGNAPPATPPKGTTIPNGPTESNPPTKAGALTDGGTAAAPDAGTTSPGGIPGLPDGFTLPDGFSFPSPLDAGTLGCGGFLACAQACSSTSGFGCAIGCIQGLSPAGQKNAGALLQCIQANCASLCTSFSASCQMCAFSKCQMELGNCLANQ